MWRAGGRWSSFLSLTGRIIDGEGAVELIRCVPAFAQGSPPLRLGPSDRSTSSPLRGGEDRRAPSAPRPAFAVWLFQRTLLAAGEEVGKRGTGPSLSIVSTWRGLPCLAGVLALPEGTQRIDRATSVRARPSGLITQHATSACRTGAVSLHAHTVHDPCSREGDARIMRQVLGVWRKLSDYFFQGRCSSSHPSLATTSFSASPKRRISSSVL